MTIVARLLIVACLCTLGLLSFAPAALATAPGATQPPCPALGSTQVAGRTMATCLAFYSSGAAIRVPADTATTVYGVLSDTTLHTRSQDLPVGGRAWEPYRAALGLLIKARVAQGKAVDPQPVVLVTQRAVLTPLAGRHVHAAIGWLSPPEGVSDTDAVIAFPSRTTARVLNYHRPARLEGHCMPAVASTAAERAAYAPFFADGTLTVYWTPGMHTPTDSEIVLDSPVGPSWMASGPQIVDLLSGPWQPRELSFGIHANPIGTPATLTGPLMPGVSARRC